MEENNNENIEPIDLDAIDNNVKEVSNNSNETGKNCANILCIISLCLHYGTSVIALIINKLLTVFPEGISNAIAGLFSLSGLASWILMIIARVKYPKSTFAKVIMWIYIIELILSIILMIILIIACANIISGIANSDLPSQISNMISGCANIG